MMTTASLRFANATSIQIEQPGAQAKPTWGTK
jgi:hypothetical protein